MQRLRLHLHEALGTGRRAAPRLLHQQTDRIRFVQQAQPSRPALVLAVLRIHEHPAAHEDAVHLRHQRGDPAHVEIATANARLSRLALGHVAVHRRLPEAGVAGVDGKLAGVSRNLQVRMCQDEVADLPIERETMRALARADDQHGRGAVDGVAGRDLLLTPLQIVGDTRELGLIVSQHREDRADRYVHIGV